MTSLGGYQKAVEVVERVANGTLTANDNHKIANLVPRMNKAVFIISMVIFISAAAILVCIYKVINCKYN